MQIALRFLCIVLAVFCESREISFQFKRPMAVAAHGSLEKCIVLAPDGMLHLKALNGGFTAIEAARIVTPQFCPPPFEPPCTLGGIGILHALASGVT
jgi:hypothetical protein